MEAARTPDIVIVGGGVVGLALARTLAQLDMEIMLIESRPINVPETSALDNRTIALSYPSVCFLAALGLWEGLRPCAQSIARIHVSDKGHYGRTVIEGSETDLPFLGSVVEMPYLMQSLLSAVQQADNVQLCSPAQVNRLVSGRQGYALNLEYKGESLHVDPSLIVACDGANSMIRRHLDLPVQRKDYQQTAVVCNTRLKRSHQGTAYERFCADGVMAMLPLSGKRSGMIWTVPPARAKQLQQLDDQAFMNHLQQVFGYRAGRIEAVGKRNSFALSLIRAEKLFNHNVLLFGNAAHFLHPVSAQGFNLSIRDCAALYDLMASYSLAENRDKLLEQYEQGRLADQQRTAAVTNTLVGMFTRTDTGSVLARQTGMQVLARCHSAREWMNRIMMGRDGKLSRLHLHRVTE